MADGDDARMTWQRGNAERERREREMVERDLFACCPKVDHTDPWCGCTNHVRSNTHPYGTLDPPPKDQPVRQRGQ